MTKPSLTTSLLLLLVLLPFQSQAELFKWVDENGKIHYSDKKPDKKIDTKVISEKSKSKSHLSGYSSARPIIRPYEKTARKLHVLDTLYRWKKESEINQSSKVGVFHTGKGCSSRGAMQTPDVFVHQKALFPRESNLSSRINKVINGLDYESERTDKYRLIGRLKKTGGLSLHSEIVSLDFNTCAPNIRKSERLGPVSKISASRFTRHRIKLEVSWQLRSNRGQQIIFETVTGGRYSGWNQSSSSSNAFEGALEEAVLELFAKQDFIDHVLVEEDSDRVADIQFTPLTPIPAAANKRIKKLFLSVKSKDWVKIMDRNSEIGGMLFGENCSARKSLPLGVAVNKNKWLLNDDAKTSRPILEQTRLLGYNINPASADTLSQLEQSGGYSLNAKLVRVTYDACAPSLSASTKYQDTSKISFRKFSRNRVQLWIEWTLKTDRNQKLLYKTNTQGFGGNLESDSKGSDSVKEAIEMASDQLFADRKFLKLIAVQKRDLPDQQAFDAGKLADISGIVAMPGTEFGHLFIVDSANPWAGLALEKNIGYYAYGSECLPYKERKWPFAINDYPRVFPDSAEMVSSTAKVIKSLGYKYQISGQANLINLKTKLGGLSLHARIADLRFDSCAPDTSEDVVFTRSKISSSQFKRHRVIVTIDWILLGENAQDLRFQTSTKGVANNWQLNAKAKKVLGLAMENATAQLFAQQGFIDQLKASESEKGFFDNLFSYFDSGNSSDSNMLSNPYMLKAHAAQVFAEMNILKMGALEHYYSMGEWPGDLSEIGQSEAMFNSSKTISNVSFQPDGSIVVELKELFGDNKIITISPDSDATSAGVNRWNCSSNVDSDFLPLQCESI